MSKVIIVIKSSLPGVPSYSGVLRVTQDKLLFVDDMTPKPKPFVMFGADTPFRKGEIPDTTTLFSHEVNTFISDIKHRRKYNNRRDAEELTRLKEKELYHARDLEELILLRSTVSYVPCSNEPSAKTSAEMDLELALKREDKLEKRVKRTKEKLSFASEQWSFCFYAEKTLRKENEELNRTIEYLRKERRTVCPTKKFWINELNQKHSDKVKSIVRALGKKHAAKRDKLKLERDALAEHVFDVTELKAQIQSLKLQLSAEKKISLKYAKDLHEREKQQAILTAM